MVFVFASCASADLCAFIERLLTDKASLPMPPCEANLINCDCEILRINSHAKGQGVLSFAPSLACVD